MIERLDQLTLRQLIELSCGDYSVLGDGEGAIARATTIMSEYKAIVSPTQSKMDLMDAEKVSKNGMKEKCARICMVLCLKGHPEMAREVLVKLGVGEQYLATEEDIIARCQAIIGEAEYEVEKALERKMKSQKTRTPEQTRREWYSEIASVMGVFKLNIDPEHTNAAIYANLVAQAVERNKAMAKMPAMAKMFM